MIAASAFWSHWAWAAAAAVLGFAFFGLVLRQYVARRRMHQLAWAIGLLFYAVAAAMEAWSESSGRWDPAVYRVYIPAGDLHGAARHRQAGAGHHRRRQALGPSLSFARVMSLPLNITGTLLLFGGAAWSVWRFPQHREFGYRRGRTSSSPPAPRFSPPWVRGPVSGTPRSSTRRRW